jgi:glyoxylase-like metal-dependent hydrolase (beta-lactamase superfamily II)
LPLSYLVNEVGMLRSNSYLAYDSGEAVIIDAGDDAWKILEAIQERSLRVRAIYATHCHFDHVMAVQDLRDVLGCEFYIHPDDGEVLAKMVEMTRGFLGIEVSEPPKPDGYIYEGDRIRVGGETITVIHTPGHSPGSVCYHSGGILFSGDTLFRGSIGRTDAYGGDPAKILDSIINKLFTLPEGVAVLPGHGPSTEIGWEKRNNPFVGERSSIRRSRDG